MFRSNKNIPPCPDAERYVLVETKEGKYWRRKRGSVKKAVLNETLRRNAEAMKQCAPAASRIMKKLQAFTTRLEMGRMIARISARLSRQLNATGRTGLGCLIDMDLQQRFPLDRLLRGEYMITVKDGMLKVHIPIREDTVKRYSQLVSGYRFELVLLYGDCMATHSLRVETETSEVYDISETNKECHMQMVLPEKEWIVVLKVSCIEGNEMAKAARNYGMKVLGGG